MQLVIEELEPIVTATQTSRLLPTSPPHCNAEEEEPSLTRRLDRVARLCAAQIRSIDRSLVRIGRYVSRLVRHFDRERGLTALAARITREHGKIVSRQYLGQALLVFESYNEDERENRFSGLPNTHLLKAAQGFPDPCDRDARNAILDRAVKEKSSVADLATDIKMHKAANALAGTAETTPPTDEVPIEEARGYVCGNGPPELGALPDRGVGFLRVREPIASVDAISEAGRALSADGIMIVELSELEGYIGVIEAAKQAANLRFLHTLIVATSASPRNAPHNLPIIDRFRVIVLVGGYGYRYSPSQPERCDNPMSDTVVEELVYSLAPDSGLIVDILTGA